MDQARPIRRRFPPGQVFSIWLLGAVLLGYTAPTLATVWIIAGTVSAWTAVLAVGAFIKPPQPLAELSALFARAAWLAKSLWLTALFGMTAVYGALVALDLDVSTSKPNIDQAVLTTPIGTPLSIMAPALAAFAVVGVVIDLGRTPPDDRHLATAKLLGLLLVPHGTAIHQWATEFLIGLTKWQVALAISVVGPFAVWGLFAAY